MPRISLPIDIKHPGQERAANAVCLGKHMCWRCVRKKQTTLRSSAASEDVYLCDEPSATTRGNNAHHANNLQEPAASACKRDIFAAPGKPGSVTAGELTKSRRCELSGNAACCTNNCCCAADACADAALYRRAARTSQYEQDLRTCTRLPSILHIRPSPGEIWSALGESTTSECEHTCH